MPGHGERHGLKRETQCCHNALSVSLLPGGADSLFSVTLIIPQHFDDSTTKLLHRKTGRDIGKIVLTGAIIASEFAKALIWKDLSDPVLSNDTTSTGVFASSPEPLPYVKLGASFC